MVTYDGMPKTEPYQNFDFTGLSSDTKPTGTVDGVTIRNGSSFFEMDTKTVKFYDAAHETWI